MSEHVIRDFSAVVEKAKSLGRPMRVAIAGADAENILKGAFDAQAEGFVEPILIGKYKRIQNTLERLGAKDRDYDIEPIGEGGNVVQYAIEMIKAGAADCLLRGNVMTRDFLLPVINKANHLINSGSLLTQICVLDIPDYPRLLAISDVTVIVEPSVEQREIIIRNMVDALKVFGLEKPNIAILSLVEAPSFHMADTVEAQTLVKKHSREPFADCNLVGPIPYDLIVSKEAARLKNYDCPYCGEFDGILVPDLLSGNLIVKVLQKHLGVDGCGILVGANIPIAISSRSDGPSQAYYSLAACAAMIQDGYYNK